MSIIHPPRGTNDFLELEALQLEKIEFEAKRIFNLYNYHQIRLPLIEDASVFTRTLGDETEIIEKQMFKLFPLEKNLCLRPEGTAQVARSYLSNKLYAQNETFKCFYIGAMFRGERPQKGRFRQFHHLGAECIGPKNPWVDTELIVMAKNIVEAVGIQNFRIEVNSLGCSTDKKKLSQSLREELTEHKHRLCEHCQTRLEGNVLRILDCKNTECQAMIASVAAPTGHRCDQCNRFFEQLCKNLTTASIPYVVVPTLVRGLDYYTQTVFEITSNALGAQNAIGAGGRYDQLIEHLGGAPTAAAGFALGEERLLLTLDNNQNKKTLSVFIAITNESLYNTAFTICQILRGKNISCDFDFSGKSLKGQLKYSQKLNARFVVIVGEEEVKRNAVILRDMLSSHQEEITLNALTERIQNAANTYVR